MEQNTHPSNNERDRDSSKFSTNGQADSSSILKEFHLATSEVSQDILETSQKLGKLTKLIKKKTRFDDPTNEINRLVYEIKEEISLLNNKLDITSRFVENSKNLSSGFSPLNSSGTNGTKGTLAPSKQSISHSNQVVGTLRGELANATKTFKDLLQLRSNSVKSDYEKRHQLGTDNQFTSSSFGGINGDKNMNATKTKMRQVDSKPDNNSSNSNGK